MRISDKTLLWLGLLAAFVFICYLLQPILFPFVTAMVLSYLLNPLVAKLEKYLGRSVASLLVVTIVCAILLLFLVMIGPIVYEQISSFVQNIPVYKNSVQTFLIPKIIPIINKVDPGSVSSIQSTLANFSSNIMRYIGVIIGSLINSSMAILNIISLLFITPIVTFYLLRDWNMLVQKFNELLPLKHARVIREQLNIVDLTLSGYLRGQLLVCIILSAFYIIALTILDLQFAFSIGLISGLLVAVPYVGVIVGIVSSVLVDLFQSGSTAHLLSIVAVFIVGQVIEGNVITPNLVGDKIGLHPVWMMLAVLAGAVLFGFIGVLLAIPVAAILGVLVRFLVALYKNSDMYSR
jgi:predicted PurR-regulated permease PerM